MIDWTFHDLAFLSAMRISINDTSMTLEEIHAIAAGIEREESRALNLLLARKIIESGEL